MSLSGVADLSMSLYPSTVTLNSDSNQATRILVNSVPGVYYRESVNRHSTATHYQRPNMTHPQEGGTGGEVSEILFFSAKSKRRPSLIYSMQIIPVCLSIVARRKGVSATRRGGLNWTPISLLVGHPCKLFHIPSEASAEFVAAMRATLEVYTSPHDPTRPPVFLDCQNIKAIDPRDAPAFTAWPGPRGADRLRV